MLYRVSSFHSSCHALIGAVVQPEQSFLKLSERLRIFTASEFGILEAFEPNLDNIEKVLIAASVDSAFLDWSFLHINFHLSCNFSKIIWILGHQEESMAPLMFLKNASVN